MSNERCMICLDITDQDQWDYKYECSIYNCKNVICLQCYDYMRLNAGNVADAAFPLHYSWSLNFKCSLACLINTTIDKLDIIYIQTPLEQDFIKKQQKLLESIYATNALNNFLYKDLVNIINEYIYTK